MKPIVFLLLSAFTAAHSIPHGYDAVRLTVLTLACPFLLRALLKNQLTRLLDPYLTSLLLLFGASLIWSIDKDLTAKYLLALLPFSCTYILVTALTKSRRDFLAWRYYFIILLFASSSYTFLLHAIYGSVRLPALTKAIAIDASADLAVAFPVLIHLSAATRSLRRRLLYLSLVLAGITAAIITQTRALFPCLVASSLASAYFFLINRRFRIRKTKTLASKTAAWAILFGTAAILSWQFLIDESSKAAFLKRLNLFSPDPAVRAEYLFKYDERIVAWEDMQAQIKENWPMGIGFGAFAAVSRNGVIVHNLILDALISAGIPGLFAAILFLARTISLFYAQARSFFAQRDPSAGYFSLTLSISFISLLAFAAFHHVWFFNHLYLLAGLARYTHPTPHTNPRLAHKKGAKYTHLLPTSHSHSRYYSNPNFLGYAGGTPSKLTSYRSRD